MRRLTRQQIFAPCRRKAEASRTRRQGQAAASSVADRAVGGGQGMRLGAAPVAASPAADSGSPSRIRVHRHLAPARGSRGAGAWRRCLAWRRSPNPGACKNQHGAHVHGRGSDVRGKLHQVGRAGPVHRHRRPASAHLALPSDRAPGCGRPATPDRPAQRLGAARGVALPPTAVPGGDQARPASARQSASRPRARAQTGGGVREMA